MLEPFVTISFTTLARLIRLAMSLIFLLTAQFSLAADKFLQPEEAFQFSAQMLDSETAQVTYKIADGYYMYRDRFAFSANGAVMGTADMPEGTVKFDKTFQKNVETFRHELSIRIPVEANGNFTLTAVGQGCSDQGLCYAPMESQATLSPAGRLLDAAAPGAVVPQDPETGKINASLQSGKLTAILPLFLLLGLGLAFTPCVLPMMPILSSIILGEGATVSRTRGFTLSLAYSMGMALVYTLLGISAGLAGEGLAAALQNPWVLSAFAILMAALALSMFGLYQLQVPSSVQARLAKVSERQASGKFAGVFVMGAISALIVGPCVAAPLAGTLLYISQTRDVLVGGSALFAMAAGMSIPLLLLGLSAGTLLPRTGAWMEAVKIFFGVLMLGLALWIVTPVIPGWIPMMGWAALGFGYGTYLIFFKQWGWLSKLLGTVVVAFGLLQFAGVVTGGTDPLSPLAHLGGTDNHVQFKRVKSLEQLESVLAATGGKAVMLDFYADWCVSCKEMEKFTFSDRRVREQMDKMILLQADVTANDDQDKALLKRFRLFGPPGIIFFDKAGREIPGGRVIGYQDADKFLRSLDAIERR